MADGDERTEGGEQSDDTMRERAGRSRVTLWVLLDADRRLLAGALSAALFCGLVGAGVLHSTPAQTLLTRGDPAETLYQALVTATVTGVTLVLTLNQVILSQELGAVGDQRDRMEGAMEFRADAAEAVGTDVSPAEPSAFLRALVAATREEATALADAAAGTPAADPVRRYVDSLTDNADAVTDQLEGASFGEYDVLAAALNYNYSLKLYDGKRLRAAHAEDLPADAVDRLDALLTTLELFGPAREHFKTLYFQWELADLSRTLLYVAMPALAVAIAALLFLDPGDFPGATLGVPDSLLAVAATTTVSLLPFTVLLTYVLRIVTITKRTLSIGPFVLRDADRSTDVDGE